MSFFDATVGWALCLAGFHRKYALCQDHPGEGPPEGHFCRPTKSSSPDLIAAKFHQWTMLRCRRTYCTWHYPRYSEYTPGRLPSRGNP